MKLNAFIFLLFLVFSLSAQDDGILKKYSQEELLADFDLAVSALKEAHAGLYWYNSIAEFDTMVNNERLKLKDGMDSYEFFRILSKIVASTKEGHCRIASSRDIGEFFNSKALILPFVVKMLNEKLYLLNDIKDHETKGLIIAKINDLEIEDIINTIFSYSSKYADGFIKTGKIRYTIDYSGFAYHFADYFPNNPSYEIELLDQESNEVKKITIKALHLNEYRSIENEVTYPRIDDPIELKIDHQKSIAILSAHSFRHTYFDKAGDEQIAFQVFSSKIDSVFASIQESKVKHLIIDVRNNGGGTEGYEDYLFSYLTETPYTKYNYVEANGLSFSFLKHSQHSTDDKQKAFERDLVNEFDLQEDGRYLRKEGFMQVAAPKRNAFKGGVYVLISGKTYSGGAEFAGLLKDKSEAVFVGEETGGGFYGKTSGFGLTLTLPVTKMRIRIPLFKYFTNFESKDIPFGRGVIPDHKIQATFSDFTNGIDSEMEFTIDLIENKQ